MSMIVYHYKTLGEVVLNVEEDSYVTRYLGINIPGDYSVNNFPTFDTLNNYLNTIRTKYSSGTLLNNSEIAALNFACGILVEMDYSYSMGSGAYLDDVATTLTERMGYYSAENVHISDPEFYIKLKNNMMDGDPALLTINKSQFCESSHVIICDGYNTDGFYHLNFG